METCELCGAEDVELYQCEMCGRLVCLNCCSGSYLCDDCYDKIKNVDCTQHSIFGK